MFLSLRRRAGRTLKTAEGRITTGLALILTTTALCEPTFTWVPNWGAIVAFVGALGVWFFGCLDKGTPSRDDDRQLLQRFLTTLTENEQLFLRMTDFGSSFELQHLNGMTEIHETWHGPSFEFVDEEIQRRFATVLESLRAFRSFVSLNTYYVPGSNVFVSVLTDQDRKEGRSEITCERATKMNNDASELTTAIDDFVRFARQRV
jgi:hypothetical protein